MISGAGNSSSTIEYTFLDTDPLPGPNYYRLTQFDFDGTSSSSDILYFEKRAADLLQMSVANRVLTIFSEDRIDSLTIFSTGGRLLTILHDIEDRQEIDLGDIPSGIYAVNITTAKQSVGSLIFIQ